MAERATEHVQMEAAAARASSSSAFAAVSFVVSFAFEEVEAARNLLHVLLLHMWWRTGAELRKKWSGSIHLFYSNLNQI